MFEINENNIPLIPIKEDFFVKKNINLFLLREDLIHPQISGNKWRKLKYNIQEAKEKGFDTILTFGGAFSNHIAATSAAGKEFGFKTFGIIRGNEVNNSTLDLATEKHYKRQLKIHEKFKKLEETSKTNFDKEVSDF